MSGSPFVAVHVGHCAGGLTRTHPRTRTPAHTHTRAHAHTRAHTLARAVWDYVKKKCLHNLVGHDDQVSCGLFHPTDVELLLSGSNDQTVAVWHFPTSTLLYVQSMAH